MKTKFVLETLVLGAALAFGQAQAAPISLSNATVTATYNGTTNLVGLDHQFASEAGSNVTKIVDNDLELLTSDSLYGFDFSTTGLLTIYANDTIPVGTHTFTFDFGNTLTAALGSFLVVDASGITGAPVLSVLNSHTLSLNLSNVSFNEQFGSFTTQIGAAARVPEPGSIALLLAGAAGIGMSRRKRKLSA